MVARIVRELEPPNELARAAAAEGLARYVDAIETERLLGLVSAPIADRRVRPQLVVEPRVMGVIGQRGRRRVRGRRGVVDVREVCGAADHRPPVDNEVVRRRRSRRRVRIAVRVVLANEIPTKDVRRIGPVALEPRDVRCVVERNAELHRDARLVLDAPCLVVGGPEEAQKRPLDPRAKVHVPRRPHGHDFAGERPAAKKRLVDHADRNELLASVEYESILRRLPVPAVARVVVRRDAAVDLPRDEGNADIPAEPRDAVAHRGGVREAKRRLRGPARCGQAEWNRIGANAGGELGGEAFSHALNLAGALRKTDGLTRHPRFVRSRWEGHRLRRLELHWRSERLVDFLGSWRLLVLLC